MKQQIHAFGNSLLIRSEVWGMLVSDLTHDRVWGFDIKATDALKSMIRDLTECYSKAKVDSPFISELKKFKTFSESPSAKVPWGKNGSFFIGQLPNRKIFLYLVLSGWDGY